jgi:hypothetical protein
MPRESAASARHTGASLLSNAQQLATVTPARWVFFLCLTIYVAITPWVASQSWAEGDEPAYLLLTHSLVFDHDFDVSNNYQSKDYRAFYPYGITDQHTVTNARGEKLLWHDVGVSLLLVPGYWASGRMGAMIEIDIAAALLAAAIFVLARQLGASERAAFLCSLLFALSSPLVYYSSQIFPEVLGAACCAWAVVFFIQYIEKRGIGRLVISGILLAVLPWLCMRFWLLAGALAVVIAAYLFRTREQILKAAAAAGLPMLVSLLVFGAFDYRYFGTVLPNAGYLSIRESYPQFWYTPQIGFLGMLLDRECGLLTIAPVYLLAFAGAVRHSKRQWQSAALLAPALAYMGLMSLSQHWNGGFSPAARYVLCSAAMLAPFAALVITEKRARPFALILGLWGLLVSVIFTVHPLLRYPSVPDNIHDGLDGFLLNGIHVDPGVIFPSIDHPEPADYAIAMGWVVGIFACMWWLNPKDARRSLAMKVVGVATGGILVSCLTSYAALRRPEAPYHQTITSSVKELRVHPKERFVVPINIQNRGSRSWRSTGPQPIVVSYQWTSGEVLLPIEGLRTLLPRAVKPNDAVDVTVMIEAPDQHGDLQLRFSLVEEGVAWFISKSHEYLRIPAAVQ